MFILTEKGTGGAPGTTPIMTTALVKLFNAVPNFVAKIVADGFGVLNRSINSGIKAANPGAVTIVV